MDVRRISPALTVEQKLDVVTLATAKAQARVSHAAEDVLITSYIAAAFDFLTGPAGWLVNFSLLRERFALYLAAPCPRAAIELPRRPFADDVAPTIEARQPDGTYLPINGGLFDVVGGDVYWRIVPTGTWPATGNSPLAYRITFSAGFAAAQDVPEPFRQAIRLLVAEFYENRSASADALRAQALFGVRALIGGYRLAKDHS